MRRPFFLLPALLLTSATLLASGSHNHHGSRNISFDDFDNGANDCSAMRMQIAERSR